MVSSCFYCSLIFILIVAKCDAFKLNSTPIKITTNISKFIAISTLSLSILLGSSASIVHAGLFDSAEQSIVNDISNYQKPIFELLDQLKPITTANPIGVWTTTQLLKGGKEDSDVVLNYASVYFQPLQIKMEKASKILKISDETSQKRLETLPLLLKGHLLELNQAITSQKAPEQEKEVEEIQETTAEFLKLVSTNYDVNPYIPPRPLTDKEIFGPLGCEFWGKKRLEGSNACTEI